MVVEAHHQLFFRMTAVLTQSHTHTLTLGTLFSMWLLFDESPIKIQCYAEILPMEAV